MKAAQSAAFIYLGRTEWRREAPPFGPWVLCLK